jgi:hypothetical protein
MHRAAPNTSSLCASLASAVLISLGCSNGAGANTPIGSGSSGASSGAGAGFPDASTGNGTGSGGDSSGGSSGGGSSGTASGTAGGMDANGTAMSGAGASGAGASGSGAGASGSAASGSGMPAAVDMSVAVLERNKHPSRDGNFLQPLLTKAKATTMAPDVGFKATFAGAMWASPLYLDQGPGGKGIFIAVTTGNDVFALDETDGHTVWTKNIGNAPMRPGVPCGNIFPIGMLSTPVIDPKPAADGFATIYVAGGIGTTAITAHEVHALSAKDGTERAGWPVNASTVQAAAAQAAGYQFNLPASNQRSALSLVGGILYVAYGGHVNDCGGYRGYVVAINTADPTKAGAWVTQGIGEAIWAAGGMASDGIHGVFAVTGNRTGGGGAHQDSEEVVHVTGLGVLNRTDANIYYPSNWNRLDASDLDFGSSSPVYFTLPGATPANYVGAATKDGTFYLLDSANLGGMDGHKAMLTIADGGMSLHTVLGAYTSTTGMHVVLQANAAHCPGGNGNAVISISIPVGTPPMPKVAWCSPQGGANTAPIATTIDGKNDAIVWFMNGPNLAGVDGDTGAKVAIATGQCAGVQRWTSPIAVKGRIVVGADNKLCSWSPH